MELVLQCVMVSPQCCHMRQAQGTQGLRRTALCTTVRVVVHITEVRWLAVDTAGHRASPVLVHCIQDWGLIQSIGSALKEHINSLVESISPFDC
jgi:hypothetical protein